MASLVYDGGMSASKSGNDHDDVVRRSFEGQTGLFQGKDALFARRPASALDWLGPLDRDMVVLDVACGAAHAAEMAAPHVRQVVGIDLTRALLELAADRLGKAGIKNVLLQEGGAAHLPFLDASFDVVMCRSAVHHFADPERSVAEMARVAKPGGRVVIADMTAPSVDVRAAFDDLHRRIDPSHVGVLLESELGELVRAKVGPLTYGETSEPIVLPVELIMTEATVDRDGVVATLREELNGGPTTGFSPVAEGDRILVSFSLTVIHATAERSASIARTAPRTIA